MTCQNSQSVDGTQGKRLRIRQHGTDAAPNPDRVYFIRKSPGVAVWILSIA